MGLIQSVPASQPTCSAPEANAAQSHFCRHIRSTRPRVDKDILQIVTVIRKSQSQINGEARQVSVLKIRK